MGNAGESWQDIMSACSAKEEVKCEIVETPEYFEPTPTVVTNSSSSSYITCGSDFAFPYFISFYFLCSFLVSSLLFLLTLFIIWEYSKPHLSRSVTTKSKRHSFPVLLLHITCFPLWGTCSVPSPNLLSSSGQGKNKSVSLRGQTKWNWTWKARKWQKEVWTWANEKSISFPRDIFQYVHIILCIIWLTHSLS